MADNHSLHAPLRNNILVCVSNYSAACFEWGWGLERALFLGSYILAYLKALVLSIIYYEEKYHLQLMLLWLNCMIGSDALEQGHSPVTESHTLFEK